MRTTKAHNSMHVCIVLELIYSFSIHMTIVPSTKTQNRLCTANMKKIECLVTCYNAFDFEKQISSYLKLCHEKKQSPVFPTRLKLKHMGKLEA